MKLKIGISFKRLKKDGISLIYEFLDDIDVIRMKNLNLFARQFFKSKLEKLKIYRYILNYNKPSNEIRSNKIRILNLITNFNFLHKAKNLFKVDENLIIEICLKLANYHLELEMRKLENDS